jgi:hypothetical protein
VTNTIRIDLEEMGEKFRIFFIIYVVSSLIWIRAFQKSDLLALIECEFTLRILIWWWMKTLTKTLQNHSPCDTMSQ